MDQRRRNDWLPADYLPPVPPVYVPSTWPVQGPVDIMPPFPFHLSPSVYPHSIPTSIGRGYGNNFQYPTPVNTFQVQQPQQYNNRQQGAKRQFTEAGRQQDTGTGWYGQHTPAPPQHQRYGLGRQQTHGSKPQHSQHSGAWQGQHSSRNDRPARSTTHEPPKASIPLQHAPPPHYIPISPTETAIHVAPDRLYTTQLGPHKSKHGSVYTALTSNVLDTIAELAPSLTDIQYRQKVASSVTASLHAAFPDHHYAQVEPFGSFVSGLGTKASDLDLVITGIQEPDPQVGFYNKSQRPVVARLLDCMSRQLRRRPDLHIRNLITIRNARIPLIRLTTDRNLVVDISMGSSAGPEAARYLAEQVQLHPALRPLTLILKAYLKIDPTNLNDVASGGLSSYGLTYMVLAHLQMEEKAGTNMADLGYLLHRFLKRYGCNFNPSQHAVSVSHQGIVSKQLLPTALLKYDDRITTIDPLTGRDCTEGAYRSREVLAAFEHASNFLDTVVQRYGDSCPDTMDLLSGLMVELDEGDDDEEDQFVTPFLPSIRENSDSRKRRLQQEQQQQELQQQQEGQQQQEEEVDEGAAALPAAASVQSVQIAGGPGEGSELTEAASAAAAAAAARALRGAPVLYALDAVNGGD